jgi:hypothetical protein
MKIMTDLALELASRNYNVSMIYLEDSSYVELINNTSVIPIIMPGHSQVEFENEFEDHRIKYPGQPPPIDLMMRSLRIS